MLVFDSIQEVGSGKRTETVATTRMSENYSSEANPIKNAHESNTDTEYETRIWTQEKVDEQIRKYIVPFTRELEDLTRLI